MKNFIALLFVLFAFGATAQNYQGKSDMVIIDNSGDQFYLIIDKVVQNVFPTSQLKVVGLPAKYHQIQLLYVTGNVINYQEHITLLPYKQHTAVVNWYNNQKRLNWIEVSNINQSSYGNGALIVNYVAYNNYGGNPGGNHGGNYPGGNNQGNNPGGNNHGGNHNPNWNNNSNCHSPLPTIQPIMNELNNIPFSAKKLEYAKDALANKCINSDQAYEIVKAFTFDRDRVEIAKYCYDRMTDQIYANKILDLFPHSGTREEVRKYFTK